MPIIRRPEPETVVSQFRSSLPSVTALLLVAVLCCSLTIPMQAQDGTFHATDARTAMNAGTATDARTAMNAGTAMDARTAMNGAFSLSVGSESGRKSRFLGVLYSLAVPGMGELYAGRFDRGKYPFITEIALWIGALGIDMYGDWVQDDARIYARRHAGIDPTGKDDDFFVNIENYTDLADYNSQRLIERRTDDLYPDETAWRWSWASEEHRKEYKDLRIQSDELHNAVTFFVLGMVANRIWSAIQASSSVGQYNASLEERLSSLPSMTPRLKTFAGRVDGIEFRFTW